MLSYFGLVDDFAARHRDAAITSPTDLTRNLIFAVLFDEELLINDGYIIASRAIRDAVRKPKQSPLRQLVETGYIKILTRNQRDLGTLTKRMAEEGMEPAQALLKDPEYPAFNRTLSEWCGTLNHPQADGSYLSFRGWPAYNTSQIFERLALAAIDHAISNVDDPNHKRQLRKFGDVFRACERRTRTTWEVEANRLRGVGELSAKIRTTLMHIANEAYQYSWGCALSTGKAQVKVQTRTPEFLDIDRSLTLDETLDATPKLRQGVEVYVPDVALAVKKVGDNWTRLADVNRANCDVFKAKRLFLETLETYYTSSAISDKDMKECADAYSKQLTMHFGGEGVPFVFDLGFTAASAAVPAAAGAALAGPVGAAVGFGIGLVGNIAAHMGGPKFIRAAYLAAQQEMDPTAVRKEVDLDFFLSGGSCDGRRVPRGVATFKHKQ